MRKWMKNNTTIVAYTLQAHLKKFEYGGNLFQKVKLSYILDSLHVK